VGGGRKFWRVVSENFWLCPHFSVVSPCLVEGGTKINFFLQIGLL